MRWKLVPVEPTEEMLRPWEDDDHIRFGVYGDMLAAAPPASQDEKLVEKVADLIWEEVHSGRYDPPPASVCKDAARAVLKMLEGNQ